MDDDDAVRVVLEETPIPPGPVNPDAAARDAGGAIRTQRDAAIARLDAAEQNDGEGTVAPGITETHAPERDELGHWLPGQSGNKSGRTPDKYTLGGTIKAMLAEPSDTDPTITKAEELARSMFAAAIAGDTKASIAVGERAEGKPAQAVSLSLHGSSPLHHQVNVRSTPRLTPPADTSEDS